MPTNDFTEVAKNAIWVERVATENRFAPRPQDSKWGGIRSSEQMIILPDKPNEIDKRDPPSPERIAQAETQLQSMCLLRNPTSPFVTSVLPITTNQGYGFYHKPLTHANPEFHHGKHGCDVTKYADAYYQMMQESPYAKH